MAASKGTAMAESIRTEIYRDLAGRGADPWARRLLLALLALIPLLALLDVFGQRALSSHSSGAAATLTLSAPKSIRGGLLYQSKITVVARRKLSQPKLVLGRGFLDGLTIDTIEPGASQELSRNGELVLEYGAVPAGQRLTVWFQYQVNPTTVGRQTQRLELDDGVSPIATITRRLTSFP
jgi:hypothetical protein